MNSKLTAAPPTEPDWALLRAFVAVAHGGSLTRAAQALGSSQPTLSRQIAQLEAQAGHALFERTQRGLKLTEAGAALLAPAERMREHAREWVHAAAGRSTASAGTVRLTASAVVSAFLLPEVLVGLRRSHPEIQIELLASNAVENLLERDADIALRMVRPTQTALVAKKLAEMPLGLYAHRDYIAAHGLPTLRNMAAHDWIGFDRSDQIRRGFRAATGREVAREFFAFRCDDQVVGWHAVLAGLGVGIGLRAMAEGTPQVVRVLPGMALPALPLWLTAHRGLRSTPRIQRVFDALAAALAAP